MSRLVPLSRLARSELTAFLPDYSSNDLQATINSLNYSYQRCNKAVSLPAPV